MYLFAIINTVLIVLGEAQSKCQNGIIQGSILSTNDQKTIIDVHNKYRTMATNGEIPLQPKATNMQMMSWDPKLSLAARNISETCVFEHVKVHDPRFSVGQNIYASLAPSFKTTNWTAAVEGWFDEYRTYKFGTEVYNHYTQVVWASTTLVGCWATSYLDKSVNRKLYVCNYGPAGNYIGEKPYKTT